MTSPGDSLQKAADKIAEGLTALADAFADDASAASAVAALGYLDLPLTPSALTNLSQSLSGLADARATLVNATVDLQDGTASDTDVLEALGEVLVQLGLAIVNLHQIGASCRNELPSDYVTATGIADNLEKRIVDSVIFGVVADNAAFLRHTLSVLGVFELIPVAADPTKHQPDFTLVQVTWNRLSTLLKGPSAVLADVYGWGTPTLNTDKLFSVLTELSFALLSPAEVRYPTDAFLQAIAPGATPPDDLGPMLVVPLATIGGAVIDLAFIAAPKATPGELQGLAIQLVGEGSFDQAIPLAPGLTFEVDAKIDLVAGLAAILRPNQGVSLVTNPNGTPVAFAGGKLTGKVARTLQPGETAIRILTIPDGFFIESQELFFEAGVDATSGTPDIFVQGGVSGGKLVIGASGSDGFTQKLLPSGAMSLQFDLGLGWSQRRGVFFTAAGGLEVAIPIHVSIGPFAANLLRLKVALSDGGLKATAGVVGTGTLGPVTATIDALGLEADLLFQSGNLGPLELDLGLSLPTGYALGIDAGPVNGGGFLFFDTDAGSYSGGVQLSIYGVKVTAFGLIQTKFPDGHTGFSFVIVISAEFTPIQLGFGFTLFGVGGLIGINRTINGDALQKAVIGGSIANILFPKDIVHDAPALVNDLATYFPPAEGHYLFGPMAELGWGTPALITGKLGIILELPGPRLSLLGLVQMALPTADDALVSINLAIGGLLDFPGKLFWFEAALFDSQVVGFPIQGGMAFRLTWGDNPNFALAVGGFNPAFTPPQGFPDVKRCSIDIGVNGNPSLTVQGYFAVTSNSAQVGSSIDLRASGAGITLHGYLGFDALFIFSPFSFEADFSAGVDISFHGAGFGINLHGKISGPTPYRVQAQACVSILFWDACLPVDFSFGTSSRPSLPQVDPWTGIPTGDNPVQGLQQAVETSTNWSGSFPNGAHPVVSLTKADASASSPPIDPVGQATLHQKVCPLNLKLTKFGIYQPVGHTIFQMVAITVHNDATGNDDAIASPTPVQDQFAPALFTTMKDSDKLKSPSYEPFDSGFTLQPDQVSTESSPPSLNIAFETDLVDDQGNDFPQPDFQLTMRHLTAMLGRSAAAQNGIRRAGVQRFVDPTAPIKVTLGPELFLAANACSLAANHAVTPTALPFRAAQNLLDDHTANQNSDLGAFRVVPSYLAA